MPRIHFLLQLPILDFNFYPAKDKNWAGIGINSSCLEIYGRKNETEVITRESEGIRVFRKITHPSSVDSRGT